MVGEADVPALFGLADVLAMPSLHEGFGLAALEALAAGLPLVASARAPFTEYLDETCAVLVDPLSEEAIAAGLHEALAASPARREAGRQRAEASLLGARRGPPRGCLSASRRRRRKDAGSCLRCTSRFAGPTAP